MTEQKEVALVEEISQDRAPEIFGQGGLDKFVDQVREQVVGEVPDLETDKGRKRIASLAAKVSRSKTAVEKPGREYLKRIKELPRTIETELREFTREMDSLRDEVRKPLTEFEEKEKARIEKHTQGLEWFALRLENYDLDLDEIKQSIADTEAVVVDESWDEFEAEAHRAKEKALASLHERLAIREKQEAERRELEELRKAQEEQRRKDEIAAAEKAAEERAHRKAIEESLRKEREHQLAIERAEREKAEAEARAAQAAENARKQQEAECLDEQQEQERRERNKQHRGKINREAMADLVSAGLSEADAKTAVTAIAKGSVRGASINY